MNWPAPSPAYRLELLRQMTLPLTSKRKDDRAVLAEEAARVIGVSTTTFYRNWRRYVRVDGMPKPIVEGHVSFERESFYRWARRHELATPKAPANSNEPPPVPETDAEQRAFLARTYGGYRT